MKRKKTLITKINNLANYKVFNKQQKVNLEGLAIRVKEQEDKAINRIQNIYKGVIPLFQEVLKFQEDLFQLSKVERLHPFMICMQLKMTN